MSQLMRVAGLGILGLVLVVGVGTSGDTKKGGGKKPSIPSGWKQLNLTKDQHTKVLAIASDFNAKIASLQKQIDDLKVQRLAEQVKVLSNAQKAILLKGLTGEAKKEAPSKDK
jgi:hypothetical protein